MTSIKFKNLESCLIVAEISANHGGSLRRALNLIKKAKDAGADAVKFQLYTPDTLTINARNKYFKIDHPKWGGQTLYDLYAKAYTPWDWFEKLKARADELNIMFFATSFDKSSVDFLEDLNVPLHKISSFEFNDLNLIHYAASKKKPLIMSTGMATLEEIQSGINTAAIGGSKEICLLKCVSSYPAPIEEMNLSTIADIQKRFKCTVGLSDHSLSNIPSISSIPLGVKIIEKHFTQSRKIETPDSFFSIEPDELKALVKQIRDTEKIIGKVHYGITEVEEKNKVFRRSLFIVNHIGKGEIFTDKNVRSIRPGFGISPKFLNEIIGKKAARDIKRGEPLKWEDIS